MYILTKALVKCENEYEHLSQEQDEAAFSKMLSDLIYTTKVSIMNNADAFCCESAQDMIYSIIINIQHEILNQGTPSDITIEDAQEQLDIAVTNFSYKTILYMVLKYLKDYGYRTINNES